MASKLDVSKSLVAANKAPAPVPLGNLKGWLEVKRIADDIQFNTAAEALKHVKEVLNAVEKERKELTQPLTQVKNKLDANAKAISSPVKALESHIKDLLVSYEERRHAAEMKKVEVQAAKLEKVAPQAAEELRQTAAESLASPEVAGLSFRRIRKAKVDDLMTLVKAVASGKASLDCILPNEQYLNALARATESDSPFPGVTFFAEMIAASKAS